MRAEEMKLRVMNYGDLVYNQAENFTYAVINLSKKELFLAPNTATSAQNHSYPPQA